MAVNVLLIDDDEDTGFLMSLIFNQTEGIGHFRCETNAKHALELLILQQFNPDIIFVDLTMPEMSGFEFVSELERALPERLEKIHVYILSSSARLSDREKIQEYGSVKEFILKPLTRQKLTSLLDFNVLK